jgi:uncharacterized protein (DUF58 family)
MNFHAGTFLDKDLMLRLEQMTVSAKSRIRGKMQGQRRSKQMGSSLDFADYRLYSPGDDFRQLDWNAYGRTGKPFIKLFLDEQELQVHLYVDTSKSMDFGSQGSDLRQNKFYYAKQLAACIGYVALAGYDRVGAYFFSKGMDASLPLLRGRGSAAKLIQFIAEAKPGKQGDIAESIMHPLSVPKQPGVTWLFSDFLYESGVEEAISYLRAANQEVVVVQILSPEEINPKLAGDLRLIDSESGAGKEVAMSAKVLKAYHSVLQQYTGSLQKLCHDQNIAYVMAATDNPVADTVFRLFRRSGVIS